ncbi:flavodoxin-dependent (E)-4-hydroxy-3-methylbut-2-enyl-diphosphate synthase [Ureaplasma ceti]|uniref:4-hydroxy-3-methylbut-2-en-1-yl diphosphate synthase (flavodoxin) n=1 Tax=Ureaplasma ceti TaxID=3119530 RepID=A0ABP9U9C0_9BACT
MKITRKNTKQVRFGDIVLGGQNRVLVQSMTTTKTHEIENTLNQIVRLKDNGCDYVRVAVFDKADADALIELQKRSPLTLVADIHFNFEFAIQAIEAGIPKIRLNPGNLDDPKKLKLIVEKALEHNTVIRVGVNSGSLPQDILKEYGVSAVGMVKAAERYINLLNSEGFDNIVVSLKASDPLLMIAAYKLASETFDYPLHLGVTEAGVLLDGTIKSVVGLTPLLLDGIGDTIRISLTDDPVKEVEVAKKLLNSLKIRNDMVDIVSCPTCGRLNYNMFPIVEQVREYTKDMNFPLKISILGCIVNGIGEGKEADIGIAGSSQKGIIFKKGKILKTVPESELFNELKLLIDEMWAEWQKTH